MTETPAAFERVSGALSGAYRLERELGRGGMATVYLAQDLKHHRPVAIKVLHPELAAALGHERFLREVEIAARLQHPNILTLIDSGEAGGFLYYVMPFVDGASVRGRLAREHELPVPDVVRIMREVADALSEAHAHGVVHRDIKPDNVLLRGQHAVITDFGVAKAVSEATGVHALTSVGVTLGTPTYMAPEQAGGDPAVDHRADIYALGVMAYEMLTGAPPFTGDTPQSVLAAHMTRQPEPIDSRRAAVPAPLAAIVMCCLEKDPADRWPSANDLLAQLDAISTPGGGVLPLSPAGAPRRARVLSAAVRRRWPIAGGIVLAVAILVAVWSRVTARNTATSAPPVLAVLPFENLGPPNDAYLADGLTDEVRARLAGIAALQVIGGRSAAQYKGSTKSPREIARELGATHLLTGTVQWERATSGGGRVRVSPELVRAADQATVWAEPVDGSLADVFALQARVAAHVADALDVALGDRQRRGIGTSVPTQNTAAYDAYLRGRAHAADQNRFSAPERRAAIASFERAVALDRRFAAAHARLAMAYITERSFGYDSGTLIARARESVERAVALDSTLPETQLALGTYLTNRDSEGAYRAFQSAARAAPGDAEVHMRLGLALEVLGRTTDAVPELLRAERLEPRWSEAAGELAGVYDRLFRHEEAIRHRERAYAIDHLVWHLPFQAGSYLLWRADTTAARRVLGQGDPAEVTDLLTRLPNHFAGRAIWLRVLPPAVLHAKDTVTLGGYVRGDWGTPDLYHLMKARHFGLTGRPELARAHADSVIALLEPVVQRGPGTGVLAELFTPRSTLAEAYAYAARHADAARMIDAYVDARRRGPNRSSLNLPYGLVTAAYVDVLIGRRDLAVARLTEALRLPSGMFISRALLRADPSWAPLRGHPGFERLIPYR